MQGKLAAAAEKGRPCCKSTCELQGCVDWQAHDLRGLAASLHCSALTCHLRTFISAASLTMSWAGGERKDRPHCKRQAGALAALERQHSEEAALPHVMAGKDLLEKMRLSKREERHQRLEPNPPLDQQPELNAALSDNSDAVRDAADFLQAQQTTRTEKKQARCLSGSSLGAFL